MTFEELIEKEHGHFNAWTVAYLLTDDLDCRMDIEEDKGYCIDEEYCTTSAEYEDFKQEYFEYGGELVLHWHYRTGASGERILCALLLGGSEWQ